MLKYDEARDGNPFAGIVEAARKVSMELYELLRNTLLKEIEAPTSNCVCVGNDGKAQLCWE